MDKEERWLSGSVDVHIPAEPEEHQWLVLELLYGDDLVYLAVTVGLLAAVIPFWTGISLVLGIVSSS